MSDYRLSDLLDLAIIQKMTDAYYRVAGIPIGIIDAIDGSVIVGSGWQDICVNFNRVHPVSRQRCQESDDYIKDRLVLGEVCRYKCKNGLWDFGVPVMVAGRHLATLFLGQLFYEGEAPDREYFIQQARELGFNVDEYLAALDKVPVFSREKVDYAIEYDKALVTLLADLAEHSLSKIKADKIALESERKFQAIFDQTFEFIGLLSINGILLEANRTALSYAGVEEADVLGRRFLDTPWLAHSPELQERVCQAVQVAAKGRFVRFEVTHPTSDGNFHYFDFSLKPVTDETGQTVLLIAEGRDITDRKLAERAVHCSEAKLRSFVEENPFGICRTHIKEDRFLEVNPALVKTLGYDSAEELLSIRLSTDLYHSPTERERTLALLLRHRGFKGLEVECKRKNGEPITVRLSGRLIQEFSAGALVLEGVVEDITERKQAEHALRESEERFRLVVEGAPMGIVVQVDAIYRYVNPAALAMFGAENASQLLGHSVADRIHPESRAAVKERIWLLKEGHREVPPLEERLLRLDGTVFEAEATAIQFNFKGRNGSIVFIRDITERKRADEALQLSEARARENEAKYRAIVESSDGLIYVCSMDYRIEFMNGRMIERIGRDATGELCYVALHNRKSVCPWCFNKEVRNGKIVRKEVQSPLDGRWWYGVNTPIFHDDGSVSKHAMIHDITDRKRTEQFLRESEERFRQVVEGSPIGVMIQTDGIYRYVNPAAIALFGAESADQIVGQSVTERIAPEFVAIVNERIRITSEERTGVPFMEQQHRRMDGTTFESEVSAIPFTFEERDGGLIFIRDITDRKLEDKKRQALEQQLLQAQKMEAVGRLAGGIAHDFNNILMAIQTYTELIEDQLPIQDSLRRKTEEILKAAARGTGLTSQMLAFSRKQIASPRVLGLNAVVNDAAKMLKRLIGEHIEFQVELAEALWAIEADPDQIVQVLMNLCINSRDAMPHGGKLTIATRNFTVEKRRICLHADITPGDYVKLAVADTGTGISEHLLERIFDPFFTTKEVGKGTGLGLSMVYGIVKQGGGHVWVESEPGKGTCFTIYLPRVKRAVTPTATAKAETLPRGTETLLVVEDESLIRNGMCEFLRSLGYKVLDANSGQQALIVASEQKCIDLLLTDIVMPQMSGRELSQILQSQRPDLKIIHMSGYNDDAALRSEIHELHTTFLQKPFSLRTLASKVREILSNC